MDAIKEISLMYRIMSYVAGQCFTPEKERSLYIGGGGGRILVTYTDHNSFNKYLKIQFLFNNFIMSLRLLILNIF